MSKFKSFLVLWLCINAVAFTAFAEEEEEKGWDIWDLARPFVKREQRTSIVSTENGQVTAARVSDRVNGSYLLHFITLEPNSLFLPVLLHADMVFYVHTGTGSLGWNEEDEMRNADVKKGDIYRLPAGTVFFAQSSLESERQKLRIYAIFANSINDLREPAAAPYTSISDLVLGFDKDVLQTAFHVHESVIEEILNGAKQPAIIHGQPQKEQTVTMWDKEMEYVKQLVGNKGSIISVLSKKKKKKDDEEKMYNIIEEDKDFQNCNGWSSTVTSKHLDALKGSDIGIFMVNLTKGSMMAPHWNPMATEIAIVLKGQGMVRVVCPKTNANVAECRNIRFHVKEGDVFVVPRFHPMTQIAFNNGSFVFLGFSTSAKNNNPQFLAGKASVLRTLNVDVVAASFGVPNTTITQLLAAQDESVILECASCAEDELRIMMEEVEREMEERRKREEEEARKKEEERSQEEEKAREEEEEKKRREEEKRKQREQREKGGRRRPEEEEAAQQRERAARRQREEETAQEKQERARSTEEQARRAAEEMDKRASEETRRAAEEERERERRQWEPQEGGGGRGEQGQRPWEPQEGRGEQGQRQWEPQQGRGGRGEQGQRQWEPREGRGSRGEQGRRQWEHQGGRGEREEGGRGKWDEGRRQSLKRLTI